MIMDFLPNKKIVYYIILFILILSILRYLLTIENFADEITSNTKGFYISLTPNGMNLSLNWFGKNYNDTLGTSKWRCSTSYGSIRSIRRNSEGIIECASDDEKKCIKHSNNIECINYNNLKNEKLNPITCKSNDPTKYKNNHWCVKNTTPDKWECHTTTNGAIETIRSIKKNSQGKNICASNDGQNCIKHPNIDKCNKYITSKNEKIKSYSCAPMSNTTDDNMAHWCKQGYQDLNSLVYD